MKMGCQSGSEWTESVPRTHVVADQCRAVTAVWRLSASVGPAPQADVDRKTATTRHPSSLTLFASLSLGLTAPERTVAPLHRRRTFTELARNRHHAIVRLLAHTARPSPPPPRRPTIALARAKVKAYGPLPSPPWSRSAVELRAHRGQPYPPLLLPLARWFLHCLRSQMLTSLFI